MAEEKKEYKVINAQSVMIPFSIIIAGIIVAFAIYATNGNSDSSSPSANSLENAGLEELLGQAAEEPQEAATSIDDDPILGNKETAEVAIVEFSDYECPFCKSFRDQAYEDIKENFIDTGKAILVFRDLPLSFHDPTATEAAIAAECVRDQKGDDAYYQFHDMYFASTGTNGAGVKKEKLEEIVRGTGADVATFNTCLSEEKFADEVAKDASDAASIGINGTPGFVIGKLQEDGTVDGAVVSGAQPYSVFEGIINEQLNK